MVSVVVGFLYMSISRLGLVACYFQLKKIYGLVGFVCEVKFYLVMNLIYVLVDGLDFRYVIYDEDIVHISRV